MSTHNKEKEESQIASSLLEKVNKQTGHEDLVKATADKVLQNELPWEGYRRAELIKDSELEMIKKYDKKSDEARKTLLAKEGEAYGNLFLTLLQKISKEETLQYVLTLMDKLLTDMPHSAEIFLKLTSTSPSLPFEPLIRLLTRSNFDWFTYSRASSVIASLMVASPTISEDNGKSVSNWLRQQLRTGEDKSVGNAISALQKLGKKEEFRAYFSSEDGLNLLANLLESKSKNVQVIYYTVNCLWLLSYSKNVATQMSATKIIHCLVDLVRRTGTHDKVIRMCLATLSNLLNIASNNEQMIDCGLLKPLENLKNKNWGDEDIDADIVLLYEKLQKNMAELSTFDVFKKELIAGTLDWTPAHRSEKFWKENVHRFEEENCKALTLLKDILTNSADPLVLSVACFDVGEIARFHPRGRVLIQQVGLKLPLMKHMEDKNPDVKKNSLLAVQKLMVTHWEFLSY